MFFVKLIYRFAGLIRRYGVIKGCVAEELQKIGKRPWLKLRTTVLVLSEALEQMANYICFLKIIACGYRN